MTVSKEHEQHIRERAATRDVACCLHDREVTLSIIDGLRAELAHTQAERDRLLLSFGDYVRAACLNQLSTKRSRLVNENEIEYLLMEDLLKEWQEQQEQLG